MTLNRDKSPCSEEGSEIQDIRDKTAKGYLHEMEGDVMPECQNVHDIPCLIPQAKDLLTLDERKSLRQCSTMSQYKCMYSRLYSVKHAQESVPKCTTTSASVKYEQYDNIGTNFTTGLMIYLMDQTVESTTEYYLYDFPAIVSAVGGNMGLFLGFSCYSTGKSLMDRFL